MHLFACPSTLRIWRLRQASSERSFPPNNANSRQRPFAYRTFVSSDGGGSVFDIAFERRYCIAVFDIMLRNGQTKNKGLCRKR